MRHAGGVERRPPRDMAPEAHSSFASFSLRSLLFLGRALPCCARDRGPRGLHMGGRREGGGVGTRGTDFALRLPLSVRLSPRPCARGTRRRSRKRKVRCCRESRRAPSQLGRRALRRRALGWRGSGPARAAAAQARRTRCRAASAGGAWGACLREPRSEISLNCELGQFGSAIFFLVEEFRKRHKRGKAARQRCDKETAINERYDAFTEGRKDSGIRLDP